MRRIYDFNRGVLIESYDDAPLTSVYAVELVVTDENGDVVRKEYVDGEDGSTEFAAELDAFDALEVATEGHCGELTYTDDTKRTYECDGLTYGYSIIKCAPGTAAKTEKEPEIEEVIDDAPVEESVAERFGKYRRLFESEDDTDGAEAEDNEEDTADKEDDKDAADADAETAEDADEADKDADAEDEADETIDSVVITIKKKDLEHLKKDLDEIGITDVEVLDDEDEADEDDDDAESDAENEAVETDGDVEAEGDELVNVKVSLDEFEELNEYIEKKTSKPISDWIGGEIVDDEDEKDADTEDDADEDAEDDVDADSKIDKEIEDFDLDLFGNEE